LIYIKDSPALAGTKSQFVIAWEGFMAQDPQPETAVAPPERIPFMQRLLDNPFLLLFLGVVIPTVIYILWGVMEITQIPLAK